MVKAGCLPGVCSEHEAHATHASAQTKATTAPRDMPMFRMSDFRFLPRNRKSAHKPLNWIKSRMDLEPFCSSIDQKSTFAHRKWIKLDPRLRKGFRSQLQGRFREASGQLQLAHSFSGRVSWVGAGQLGDSSSSPSPCLFLPLIRAPPQLHRSCPSSRSLISRCRASAGAP